MNQEARVDKWLWAARIFKTRSIAVAACKKGQVTMGGVALKPSRMVKVGDVVDVKKPPITYSFRILQAIEHRVGAKLIPEVLEKGAAEIDAQILENSQNGAETIVRYGSGIGRSVVASR